MPELESALAALSGVAPERLEREQGREAREDGVYSVARLHAPLPRWLVPRWLVPRWLVPRWLVPRWLVPRWLVPWSAGPELALQYFDPTTRRIQRLHHALPGAWRLPAWFVGLLAVPALGLTLSIGSRARRWLRRWSDRRALIAILPEPAQPKATQAGKLLLQRFPTPGSRDDLLKRRPHPALDPRVQAPHESCYVIGDPQAVDRLW